MTPLILENGKYIFLLNEQGTLHCLRYGQPWREFSGDKAVLSLFQEVQRSALNVSAAPTEGETSEVDAVAVLDFFTTDSGLRACAATDYECLLDVAKALERRLLEREEELKRAEAEAKVLREALNDQIQWVAAFAMGCGQHDVVMDSDRMKRARAALAAKEPGRG